MSAIPENKEQYADDSKNVSNSRSASIVSPLSDEITAEESSRVIRKIDWHVMPLMCLVYGIQFLDKTCLSYASIMGLREDTHLVGNQYSWVSSIFYLGYLFWEYPSVLLLQRFPLARVAGINIIIWGAILMCLAACKSFTHLMVARFFLGAFESSITPAFTMFTGSFYQKTEQGKRTGIWFSFNGSFGVIGAFLAYGLSRADHTGKLTIPGWQVIFILLGAITVALGIAVTLFMPNSPSTAKFLTERERDVAVERLRLNHQSTSKEFSRSQIMEAFTDPMTWLYALFTALATIPNGAITNFSSILIRGLGFSTERALLLQAPANAIAAISIFSTLYLGDLTKRRILCVINTYVVALIGAVVLWVLPRSNPTGRLMGVMLLYVFPAGFAAILRVIASNVAGTTKKPTVLGINLVAYCVGNLIGPQVFVAKEAPTYNSALITIVATFAGAILTLGASWLLLVRKNKRHEAICSSPDYVKHQYVATDNLTDRQNPEFRYII